MTRGGVRQPTPLKVIVTTSDAAMVDAKMRPQ
jgi:hypothetical protein